MPTYRVTGPDGKAYKVTAPEGATKEEVLARVQSTAAPKVAPKSRGTGIGAIDQTFSSINEALIGLGQGAWELGSAATYDNPVGRLVLGDKLVDKANSQRRQVYDAAQNATVVRPSPVARVTGQIASTIPLAKIKALQTVKDAPKLINAAKLAGQGALGGLAVRDPEQGPVGMAATGAVSNLLLGPIVSRGIAAVAPAATKAAHWLGNTTVGRELIESADNVYASLAPRMLPPRLQAPNPVPVPRPRVPVPAGTMTGGAGANAAGGGAASDPVAALSRKAQARKAMFEAVGVKNPTTGMVTRDPIVWQFERNNAGIVGPEGNTLRGAMVKVNEDLNRAAENLVRSKGASGDPEVVGRAVIDSLDAKQKEMQAVTSRLYREVREARGDVSAGNPKSFLAAFDHPDLVDDTGLDTVRSTIENRLKRYAILDPQTGVPRRDAVLTVGQAEELRKLIGKAGNGTDPNVQRARKLLTEALDDDVVDTLGDDAFKAARESAKARFEEFKKTFAGDVAGGRVAPERLPRRILSNSTSLDQLRALKKSLTTGTDEQVVRGQKALEDLGAQALEDLFDDARIGDDMMSGAKLSKSFGKHAPKFRELLSPDEFKQLQRLVTSTRNANVPVDYSFVNNSQTTSALANLFSEAKPTGKSNIKTILQHIAAFTAAGPAGNVALHVGTGMAERRAQAQAQAALQEQVRRALSPQAAGIAVQDELAARAALDAYRGRQHLARQYLPFGLLPAVGPEPGSSR